MHLNFTKRLITTDSPIIIMKTMLYLLSSFSSKLLQYRYHKLDYEALGNSQKKNTLKRKNKHSRKSVN